MWPSRVRWNSQTDVSALPKVPPRRGLVVFGIGGPCLTGRWVSHINPANWQPAGGQSARRLTEAGWR